MNDSTNTNSLGRSSSLFSVSRQHSAFSATLLLMISSLLSGVLGLVRTKYIAYVFGAGSATDAYNAAFNLPDMINYFLVGGVASITLVSILNRHRQAGDEEGADRPPGNELGLEERRRQTGHGTARI